MTLDIGPRAYMDEVRRIYGPAVEAFRRNMETQMHTPHNLFISQLRSRLEALGHAPSTMGPQRSTTDLAEPYVTIINGKIVPEGGASPMWDLVDITADEMLCRFVDAAAVAKQGRSPVRCVWRDLPKLEYYEGRPFVRVRLAYDDVAPDEGVVRATEIVAPTDGAEFERAWIDEAEAFSQEAIDKLNEHLHRQTGTWLHVQTMPGAGEAQAPSNVTSFRPEIVGGGRVIDADQILEENKGAFERLVIIGRLKDGGVGVCASHGGPDTLWLIEEGKQFLLTETGSPW